MAITSKEINLGQLTVELGGKGLIANFNNPEKKIILPADGVELTEDELKDAIAAHVAGPTQAEVIRLNREQGLAKLKELGFTDEQISALLGGN